MDETTETGCCARRARSDNEGMECMIHVDNTYHLHYLLLDKRLYTLRSSGSSHPSPLQTPW